MHWPQHSSRGSVLDAGQGGDEGLLGGGIRTLHGGAGGRAEG